MMTGFLNDPSGVRTHDPRLKRPLLYRLSYRVKWTMRDSNSRPPACEADILPTELMAHENLTFL